MRPTTRIPGTSVMGPLRRPAPVVAAVAFLVFLVLAVHYAGDPVAGRVDQRTESILDELTGSHVPLFSRLVGIGSPVAVVLWAVFLAVAALLLRRPRHALLAIAAPGVTGLATTGLKPVIGRTVGTVTGYAYPSGHTAGATAIGLAAALLLVSLVPARRSVAAGVVAAAAVLAGGAVGTGMVTIGAHYPTDTVGGFCLAVAIGLVLGLLIDRVADRRGARRAPLDTPPASPAPG